MNDLKQAASNHVIRVSLVTADEAVDDVVRRSIEAAPGLRLASRHTDAEDALRTMPSLKIHVALIDSTLPCGRALECVRKLKEIGAVPRILILAGHTAAPNVVAFLVVGADGWIVKSGGLGDVPHRILEAHRNGGTLSPEGVREVASFLHRGSLPRSVVDRLTERELDVLLLWAPGQQAKEVGDALKIKTETVYVNLANIRRKLGILTRTDANTLLHGT
jgi:DNA-binding NarL/FixJ family response regulator